MAKKAKHPKPKRIDLKSDQMRDFLNRVEDRSLVEEDYEIIQGMAETLRFLNEALENNKTSLKRLMRYLFGAPTETAKNILPEEPPKEETADGAEAPEEKDQPKRKGHGRNGASSYQGGGRVSVPHPSLKPGDECPECLKGKVYRLAMPSVVVRIVGGAPLQSTVFEMERLRCNLCGALFTAPAPEEARGGKYDDSAAAMIALLKYGCGMPFYRLEKLQANLAMPVAASTQWEIVEASKKVVEPVFDALLNEAAQGEIFHNDDTTAKILAYLAEQDPESGRKGIFTTGIVSVKNDRRIAIFMTGRNHAGENLDYLLQARASGLPPPLQMCDALNRNLPKSLQTILINCLTHARRQFTDVVESFPAECECVILLLGKVYHNDDLARERALDPQSRLELHQKESGPVMEELKAWCERQISEKLVEPNCGLGKAIEYLLSRWEKFTRFLHIPKAPLDNSICERALKLVVLNRKNSYFFKTENGAHVGDVFLTLIHTCQLAGQNPFDYLTRLLRNARKVGQAPERWLPWNYKETLSTGK